ncbi:MAG: AtpZ/AtpI family protein [Planctomycetales bacterium]|nr:AtpZ/AtpI family protein [Planctomycetales bacterium]
MGREQEDLREHAGYLHIGLQLAITILLGVLGGYWLDGRLGTAPWLTVAGSVLGMGAGFTNFILAVLRREKRRESDGGGPPD